MVKSRHNWLFLMFFVFGEAFGGFELACGIFKGDTWFIIFGIACILICLVQTIENVKALCLIAKKEALEDGMD